MAIGDKAAEAGLVVFPATQDLRLGYQNDNQRGDELAEHILNGGHPWEQITGKPALYPSAADAEVAASTPNAGADRLVRYGAGGVISVGDPSGTLNAVNKRYCDNNHTAPPPSDKADGPTATAYGRNIGGSGFYAVWMNSALQFGRNTSSERYKDQIEPHSVSIEQVLALEPVSYHRKDTPDGVFEYGLIAEQVHETMPEIVTYFAERDEDGNPIEEEHIDGVRYDLLAVALLDAVKQQQQTIAALTARVEQLENGASS